MTSLLDRVEAILPDIHRSITGILGDPRVSGRLPSITRIVMKGVVLALEKSEFYISYIPMTPVYVEDYAITGVTFAFTIEVPDYLLGVGRERKWLSVTVFTPICEILPAPALRLITAHEMVHVAFNLKLIPWVPVEDEEELTGRLEEYLTTLHPNLYGEADLEAVTEWVEKAPEERLVNRKKLLEEILDYVVKYVKPNARKPKLTIKPIASQQHTKPPPPPPPLPPAYRGPSKPPPPPPRPPRRR